MSVSTGSTESSSLVNSRKSFNEDYLKPDLETLCIVWNIPYSKQKRSEIVDSISDFLSQKNPEKLEKACG